MKAILTTCDDNGFNTKDTLVEIKIKCIACQGQGEYLVGDGSGNTVKCTPCDGYGYK